MFYVNKMNSSAMIKKTNVRSKVDTENRMGKIGKKKKEVRFNDNVVVHEVCRLYNRDMWICTDEIQANFDAITILNSMDADICHSNDEAFKKKKKV
jgi:hypothetical protein